MPVRKAILLVGVLWATLLAPTAAQGAPTIEFLNPSGYATLTLADKTDVDNTYHVVAWVKEVPASPLVEFEIQPTGVGAAVTLDADRVGTDAWEADVALGSFTDGTYTLRAILYNGVTEVAQASETIVINREDVPPPPEPETIEITHPVNGGALGFHTPKGKLPTTVIDGIASADAQQARALYTLTAPGNKPEWKACGSAAIGTGEFVRVRCVLADGDAPSAVKAVALVANQTPAPAPPQATADQTGDAHRVDPYTSQVASVEVTPPSSQANPDTCPTFTATIEDQNGRPIADANVDVHAVGPDDQLRFATVSGTTSGYQAPESNHVSSEASWNCADKTTSSVRQGDHNVPGEDDTKHIESTGGTSKNGVFTFALFSSSAGGTEIQAWGDDDDDDTLDAGETSGGALLGWGQPPPPPTTTLELATDQTTAGLGECVGVTAVVRRGGNPVSGANLDVHLTGPDAAVQFCDPGGGTLLRAPDQGGHIGDAHSDGTRHAEGETSGSGQLRFGVTSGTEGSTQVGVWLDSTDDDVDSGETDTARTITWVTAGERTITIDSNKDSVPAGRKVRISGEIQGAQSCAAAQTVKLKAKKPSVRRFRTIDETTSDAEGGYGFNVSPTRTKKYRTVAPPAGVCDKAKSRIITIKVT